MISTPLVICLAVASAVIVIALMMWKPRRRFPARDAAKDASWPSRDLTFAGLLLSFAQTVGLARAQVERSGDGNAESGLSWHGSHHQQHHGGFSGGSHSDAGGYGGDAGGGGGI
jgi:hypothetical protein